MNQHDISRNVPMLTGPFAKKGYDWWWHSFTATHETTGERKPFFIEFYTCNPALGGAEPVFGQLPENQAEGILPSYLMIKAGTWGKDHFQIHRFFGWDAVTLKKTAPFEVTAADCFLNETETHGSVCVTEAQEHPEWMCDNGAISWELTIEKEQAFHVGYGAGRLFRTLKAFEMFWHVEGMKTRYRGKVICNGETYLVDPDTCYGYADKNWGSDFTSPWVWLASSNLTSRKTRQKLENSSFVIGGGRPKAFSVTFDRKLLGQIVYEGACYEFNFSKLWMIPHTEFESTENERKVYWSVRQENLHYVMLTEIECRKENMLFIQYEAPDGSKRHNRLWNGGNGKGRIRLYRKGRDGLTLIDDIDAENVGCEYGEYEPDEEE